MSSFLVGDHNINSILEWIRLTDGMVGNAVLRELSVVGVWDKGDPEELAKLGEKMLKMNYDALDARYGEKITKEKFNYECIKQSKEQVLKSLRCYLYQCNEGNIDESQLYKTFDKLRDILMSQIIEELPAYKKAEWR